MKNLFVLTFFTLALMTTDAMAQKFSGLDKSPMDMAAFPASYKESGKAVRVIYGRPQLKGRDMATLAPTGKVWRTGANEAAEITFYKDATFGGEKVAAGTYALFTIPGDGEWTIVLNKNLNQWGAYSYDSAADVARVKANVSKGDEALEAFSMAFKEVSGGAHLVMGWGTTRVATPVLF